MNERPCPVLGHIKKRFCFILFLSASLWDSFVHVQNPVAPRFPRILYVPGIDVKGDPAVFYGFDIDVIDRLSVIAGFTYNLTEHKHPTSGQTWTGLFARTARRSPFIRVRAEESFPFNPVRKIGRIGYGAAVGQECRRGASLQQDVRLSRQLLRRHDESSKDKFFLHAPPREPSTGESLDVALLDKNATAKSALREQRTSMPGQRTHAHTARAVT